MRALTSLLTDTTLATLTLPYVATTHCQAIKLGAIHHTYFANKIIAFYSRCRDIITAHQLFDEMLYRDTVSWNTLIGGYVNAGNFVTSHQLFDEMPQQDTVTWNTMIAGYVKYGDFERAWDVFRCMRRCSFAFDEYTFSSILKGVGAMKDGLFAGKLVHSNVVKMGYFGNVYSASALLDMYAKCGLVDDAHTCFRFMSVRNSVSWNALIAGYVEVGDRVNSFWVFNCMRKEGVRLDDGTFAPLFTLLDNPELYRLATQLHEVTIKLGLAYRNTVLNSTINAYADCGSIGDAKGVFDFGDGIRDVVTWNSMLAAYLAYGQGVLAFRLFLEMLTLGFEPDMYTYTSIISACDEGAHYLGISMHGLVIKRGLTGSIPVSNSLIAMYLGSNNSNLESAVILFESMDFTDRVSWNSILTGFSQSGFSENTLRLFQEMRFEHIEVDHYAFSAVLRSCADLATLQMGQQIHVLALKSGFDSNEFVASSLIYMYSKCGIIEDARKSFEATLKDSSVTWNSLMFGYAQHGQGKVALDIFFQMRERKVKLDHITFVAVLTACSHIGLVEEGYNFLKCMESEYGVSPRMEHYACGIDLFGRAGRLNDAKSLIKEMPFQPDAMVWKTLLGACRMCGDIELATDVASQLLELEPDAHCTYVLLSDMYGHLRRWDEIAMMKRLMRDKGVKKVPGWSWIEVHNQVHSFNADDKSHSCCQDIYQILENLMEEFSNTESGKDLRVMMEG